MMLVSTPIAHSATPFDTGWYGTVVFNLMPSHLHSSHISPIDSLRMLSVMTSHNLLPEALSTSTWNALKTSTASNLRCNSLV